MLLAQLVQDVGGIKASVLAQLAGDDLERLGEGGNDELLLAGDGARVCPQELAQLHLRGVESDAATRHAANLNGAAAGDHRVVLHGAAHNHDGVVDRPLRLLDELLGAATEDDGACLGLGAAREEVISGVAA